MDIKPTVQSFTHGKLHPVFRYTTLIQPILEQASKRSRPFPLRSGAFRTYARSSLMTYSSSDVSQLKLGASGHPLQPRQGILSEFAPPLMPLQNRDRTILVSLFEREDMADIHDDIATQLSKLIPEPCWEDDPFTFLSDFL